MLKKIIKLLPLILIFMLSLSSLASTYKGIDVSHYQGDIDWKQVANDDITFTIVKATEGTYMVDSKLVQNVTNARKNNIAVRSLSFC